MAVLYGTSEPGIILSESRVIIPPNLSAYGLAYHTGDMLSLVQNLAKVLSSMADNVSYRHLARHIVMGLKELLLRFKPSDEGNTFAYSPSYNVQSEAMANIGLSLSRPLSRNKYTRGQEDSSQKPHNLSSGLGAVRGDITGHIQLTSFNDEREATGMPATQEWLFDDSFLWQVNAEDLDYWSI